MVLRDENGDRACNHHIAVGIPVNAIARLELAMLDRPVSREGGPQVEEVALRAASAGCSHGQGIVEERCPAQ